MAQKRLAITALESRVRDCPIHFKWSNVRKIKYDKNIQKQHQMRIIIHCDAPKKKNSLYISTKNSLYGHYFCFFNSQKINFDRRASCCNLFNSSISLKCDNSAKYSSRKMNWRRRHWRRSHQHNNNKHFLAFLNILGQF